MRNDEAFSRLPETHAIRVPFRRIIAPIPRVVPKHTVKVVQKERLDCKTFR